MRIIKQNAIVDDDWQLLREPEPDNLPPGKIIIPFTFWQEHAASLGNHEAVGVWIDGSTDVEQLADSISSFQIIALDFPAFVDGRCYSHARLLRERFNYTGELRAIGDVLQDQLFYMQRCGFDSFQLREDKDLNEALQAFNTFSVSYQAASDERLPLYRRR